MCNMKLNIKEEHIEFKNMPFSVQMQMIKRYPIHWHENVTEIIMPVKGVLNVESNFERIIVGEGDFYFINNGAIHSIQSSSDAVVITFHIDLNYFEEKYENIKYMFFRNNMFSDNDTIIESDNMEDETKKLIKSKFRNLLISIMVEMINNPYKRVSKLLEDTLINSLANEFEWLQFLKKSDDKPLQLDRYYRIVKYIHDNKNEKISLDDITSFEYVTKNYFSHFWKDLSYFSFMERVNYERVMRSEFLLLTTDLSMLTISEECGFSDVKYYYNHFKRWFGCTPVKLRERCNSYMSKKMIYKDLNAEDLKKALDEYINYQPHFKSIGLSDISSMENNFPIIKHLFSIDKDALANEPVDVVLDLFNYSNIMIDNENISINWYAIYEIIILTNALKLNLNIKIRCSYIDSPSFYDIINKFLDFCLFHFGDNAITNWNFLINYNEDVTIELISTIKKTIQTKIKNAKVKYYLDI